MKLLNFKVEKNLNLELGAGFSLLQGAHSLQLPTITITRTTITTIRDLTTKISFYPSLFANMDFITLIS